MLKQRAITAFFALIGLAIVLFVLPPQAGIVLIGILLLAGAWEWSGFFAAGSIVQRVVYVALVAVLMLVVALCGSAQHILILQLACIWWLLAFIWTLFFPTAIPTAVRWVCGVLVLLPLSIVLPKLLLIDSTLLIFVLLIVWTADMGAYFAGKLFGRVKLAPSISPGKTWEGVIGGMLLVAALAFGGSHYFRIEAMTLLPFCMAVAAISIVGDLTVSMFKRTAGVKDSGSLFPGHGGVLDRIDSVAAAAPLFMLGLGYVGLSTGLSS